MKMTKWLFCSFLFAGFLACASKTDTSQFSAPVAERTEQTASLTEALPKPIFSSDSDTFLSIDFLNEKTGVIGGTGEYLALTADGGETWKKVNIRKPVFGTRAGEYDLTKVLIAEPQTIVAVGQIEVYGSAVFQSVDMGKSWTINEYPGVSINGLAKQAGRIWVTGNGETTGEIFQLNAGKLRSVWKADTLPLTDIGFTPSGLGIALGRDGSLAETEKDGITWKTVPIPYKKLLMTLALGEAGKVVIFGEDGTVIRSPDGGISWSVDPERLGSDIHKAAFTGDDEVWVLEEKRVARYRLGARKVDRSIPVSGYAYDIAGVGGMLYLTTRDGLYRID